MKKKFQVTMDLAYTVSLIFGVCGVGYVLIALSAGTLKEILPIIILYYFIIIVLWIAFRFGTYILIDEYKIRGTIIFIPGKIVQLKDIIAIKKRSTFGGLITELYSISVVNGTQIERGLVSKDFLSQNDLKTFLEMIKQRNPKVEIQASLLNELGLK